MKTVVFKLRSPGEVGRMNGSHPLYHDRMEVLEIADVFAMSPTEKYGRGAGGVY